MQRATPPQISPPAPEISGGERVLPMACRGVSLSREGRTILDRIDLTLGAAPGLTAVLGPNGAGKSVLIRVLCGLLAPDSGFVTWGGTAPNRARMLKIGLVFQKPVLLRRSARANIEYALGVTGTPSSAKRQLADAALQRAGLAHLSETDARVLSSGEQQRLTLARALAVQPGILVLDEPSANLDPASTAAIEKVVRNIRDTGTPVVLITHDLGQARRLSDEIIFLHKGKIIERTQADMFFAQPKSAEAQAYINGEIVL